MRRATVVCEECGTRLTVTDRQIGVLGECPRCYIVFQMAEVAVPRGLFGAILNRVQTLSPAPT